MALNGSAASGRFVGAELVIDPIGTAFEPLEHSPAPFRSHLISGECIGDFVMSMLDWNGYRQQVLSGVGAFMASFLALVGIAMTIFLILFLALPPDAAFASIAIGK